MATDGRQKDLLLADLRSKAGEAGNMVTNAEIGNNWYRYRFDDITFDEDQGRLEVAGMAVTIERKPLAVLSVLLRQVGAVCTRDDLLAEVWPEAADSETPLSEHALPMAVSKLRSALGPVGWQRLQTIKSSQSAGVEGGYRFLGPIERTLLRRDLAQRLELAAGQVVPGRAPYRLVRALDTARGTQPRVWLAEHPATGDQRVFKFCADAAQLSALKREYTLQRVLRQTLQGHAGIVPVVNAHFDDEPFWVEMPYAGQNLVAWAAEGHLANLTQAQRLALFLPVAQCVQDAHGVGVLHKDIKPSNVLISHDETGAWRARLADFDSGRLLDKEALSRLGVTGAGLTVTTAVTADSGSGTLMYLAPEVLTGEEPTVQSDLYALGLVLFQLLVGDFQRSVLPGWERDVADALLREDIAAATQADPGQRIRAVAQWAGSLADLTQRREQRANARLMQDRLAQAEAEATRYKARRPWVATAMLSLAVGFVSSVWFYSDARESLKTAQQQARRAETINQFLTQDLLQATDISRVPDPSKTSIRDVLNRAAALVSQRFKDQPGDEADVRVQLATSFVNMGAFDDAQRELQTAVSRARDNATHDELTVSRWELERARALAAANSPDAAQAIIDRHQRGLTDQAQPSLLGLWVARAQFELLLARMDMPAAVKEGRLVLQAMERLQPDALRERQLLMSKLVDALLRSGDFDAAIQLGETALSPPFSEQAVGVVTRTRVELQLVSAKIAKGDDANVEPRLLAIRETQIRANGPNDLWAAKATNLLGMFYADHGKFSEAIALSEETLRAMSQWYGPDDRNTQLMKLNIALLRLNLGQSAQTLKALNEQRPWFVNKAGSERDPFVQSIDFYRAHAMIDLGQAAPALAILQPLDWKVIATTSPSENWPWRLQGQRGRALLKLGQVSQAKPLLQEAVKQLKTQEMADYLIKPYEVALKQAEAH